MTDPVKDALRAAGEAARDTLDKTMCCEVCAVAPCYCADRAAAFAVAAFLRALPWMHWEPEEPGHGENLTCAELAAAVEAAQEPKP